MIGGLVGLLHSMTLEHVDTRRQGILVVGWRMGSWLLLGLLSLVLRDLLRLPIADIDEVHRLWCLVMVMHLNVV